MVNHVVDKCLAISGRLRWRVPGDRDGGSGSRRSQSQPAEVDVVAVSASDRLLDVEHRQMSPPLPQWRGKYREKTADCRPAAEA